MNSSHSRMLLSTVAIIGLISTATLSKSSADNSLFPTTKGSTWKYSGTAAATKLSMGSVISDVKTSNGVSTVEITWDVDGRVTQKETYLVSKQGVSRAKSGATGKDVLNPPIPIIKYPAKIGQSWNWKGTITVGTNVVPATGILTVTSLDDIKTKAGGFKAYCVSLALTVTQGAAKISLQNKYWFAAGAGLIKQTLILPGQDGKSVVVDCSVDSFKIK